MEAKQKPLKELTDKELNELIAFWYGSTRGTGHKDSMIAALISEQSHRQSSRTSKLSFWISIVAIIIASFAVLFSFLDYKGDLSWQKQQLKTLNEIKKILEKKSE